LFLYCCCFVVAAFICIFCIFMTYSTYYCCHYNLMDQWNEWMNEYVCRYVWVHVVLWYAVCGVWCNVAWQEVQCGLWWVVQCGVTCVHVHKYIYMYVFMYVRMYAYIYVCMYISMWTLILYVLFSSEWPCFTVREKSPIVSTSWGNIFQKLRLHLVNLHDFIS
jgi:hypothetical protein